MSASPVFDSREAVHHARAWRVGSHPLPEVICVQRMTNEIALRVHERASLMFIDSRATVRLESHRNIATDHESIVFVPPRLLHGVSRFVPAPNESLTLLLGAPFEAELPTGQGPVLVSQRALGRHVASLRENESGRLSTAGFVDAIQSILEELMRRGAPVRIARSTHATPLIPVRDYLRTHVEESVPIETLVRLSGLTEFHLIRSFHREFGLPPHAYHVRLKLARAREMLLSGATVVRTAFACGFADQSHLSRKFKEVYGLAPVMWRTAAAPRAPAIPFTTRTRVRAQPSHRDVQSYEQEARFTRRVDTTTPLRAARGERQ
jgi:AraC-like DNA-binding protein